MNCKRCPNTDEKGNVKPDMVDCCGGLYNKISCFLYELYDMKVIYISNGSEGLAVTENIYNQLKHLSTEKKEREGQDAYVPKPSEIMGQILKSRVLEDFVETDQ